METRTKADATNTPSHEPVNNKSLARVAIEIGLDSIVVLPIVPTTAPPSDGGQLQNLRAAEVPNQNDDELDSTRRRVEMILQEKEEARDICGENRRIILG